jgi:flagellar motility protein MotE (MotC chaperone)
MFNLFSKKVKTKEQAGNMQNQGIEKIKEAVEKESPAQSPSNLAPLLTQKETTEIKGEDFKPKEEILFEIETPAFNTSSSEEELSAPLFISQSKFLEARGDLANLQKTISELKKEVERLKKSFESDKELIEQTNKLVSAFSNQISSFESKMGKSQT